MGDALLAKVADRFRSATRDSDLVARLGGDEFAVLQFGVPQPASAEALATRLVDLIGRAYVLNGHVIHIGASVGIAVFPYDGGEPDALLKSTDLALYRAKEEGRACYRFFEPQMMSACKRGVFGDRFAARFSTEAAAARLPTADPARYQRDHRI